MKYAQITNPDHLELGSFYWVRSKGLPDALWTVRECFSHVSSGEAYKELGPFHAWPDNHEYLFSNYEVYGPIDKPDIETREEVVKPKYDLPDFVSDDAYSPALLVRYNEWLYENGNKMHAKDFILISDWVSDLQYLARRKSFAEDAIKTIDYMSKNAKAVKELIGEVNADQLRDAAIVLRYNNRPVLTKGLQEALSKTSSEVMSSNP